MSNTTYTEIKGEKVEDRQKIADKFNTIFVEIGPKLAEKYLIQTHVILNILKKSTNNKRYNEFKFKTVTMKDLMAINN